MDRSDQIIVEFEKHYPKGPTIRCALSLPFARPHTLVLFGPSGSGKSTLLRCIAGLERPDAGRIQCGREIWFDASRKRFVPPSSRSVGYLFQDYALFPHLSVERNIGYGLRGAGEDRTEAIRKMIAFCKLEGREGRYPAQLSGGEQQRVALARALLRRPKLLLLDEPLSALDAPTRDQLRGDLRRFLREFQIPAVYVTHDPAEALTLADQLAVISEGEILQVGTPEAVFNRPASEAVAAIVGVDTMIQGRISGRSAGLILLDVAGVRIWAVEPSVGENDFYLSIRAEDVILQKGTVAASSARNHLSGRVSEVRLTGAVAKVKVDCGFQLTALVTRQAVEALELHPGAEITAVVKASSIHLIPV